MAGTFTCPERGGTTSIDEWVPKKIGGSECSYCGGLKPEAVLMFVADGTVIHGKGEIRYLGGVRKVQMAHFTAEQRKALDG